MDTKYTGNSLCPPARLGGKLNKEDSMTKTEALREALYQTLKMETIPELYTRHKVDDILRLCKEHGLMFVKVWVEGNSTGIEVEPLEVE